MSGAIVADRYTVAAALIQRVDADDVRDPAAVDVYRRAIDVLQRVGFPVVVGIERFAWLTVPPLGLFIRHLALRPGEDAAGGNTGAGEAVIVRSAVEMDVLSWFSGSVQVGHQRAFDARRSFRYSRHAVFGVRRRGLVAVVGEVAGIRR